MDRVTAQSGARVVRVAGQFIEMHSVTVAAFQSIECVSIKYKDKTMQPVQVETGSSTIFRFDNMLDANSCQQLHQYITSIQKTFEIDKQKMPWFEGDSFSWFDIPDNNLKRNILAYKNTATRLIGESFKKTIYPEFTDIVLWRAGRKMSRHLDDGQGSDPRTREHLKSRVVSSVLYINDDYTGGETFIATEQGTDYISQPRAGSMVCFLSNEQNKHGVNEIMSGNRLVVSIWYCEQFEKSETHRHADKIKEIAGLV